MPKGPGGQHWPADAVGCAGTVARLATGEIQEVMREASGKASSRWASSVVRGASVTHEDHAAIVKSAAVRRWG